MIINFYFALSDPIGFVEIPVRLFAAKSGIEHVQSARAIRFTWTMKMNLIALTLLGLVAVFLAGCAGTTETTTTTRTREQSSLYAR
ncbi:MAG TPA: hypothetical protein VLO30_05990 [Chthoniobacterales bacterium]|nr:hypothetical protein [Chthoniobacterales bacterium]